MFKDRQEAGQKLALKLRKIVSGEDFVVIALLRGGIVLGKKISDYFKFPLFPLAVKKIGAPQNPELAIGAVTFDKTSYFDEYLIGHLRVDNDYIKSSLETKWREAKTLQKKFPTSPGTVWYLASPKLRGASKNSLKDKKVIIVDDGIATGTTAICAAIYVKKEAREIMLATPVISKDSLRNIRKYFDRIVSLKTVDNLTSVSQFYNDFPQVEDKEVIEILNRK